MRWLDSITDSKHMNLSRLGEKVKISLLQSMGLRRVDSLEKTLMLGGIVGRRRRG